MTLIEEHPGLQFDRSTLVVKRQYAARESSNKNGGRRGRRFSLILLDTPE